MPTPFPVPTHFPHAGALPRTDAFSPDRRLARPRFRRLRPESAGMRSPPRPRFRPAFVAVPASDPTSSPPALPLCPRSRFGPAPASARLCAAPRPARMRRPRSAAAMPSFPSFAPRVPGFSFRVSPHPRIPASHSEPGFGRPPRPHSLRIPPPSAATPPASPGSPAHASSAFFPRAPVSGLSGHHFFSPLLCIPPRMPPRALARKSTRFSGKFSSVPVFSVDMPSVFPRHTPSFFHKTGKSLRRKAKKTLPM